MNDTPATVRMEHPFCPHCGLPMQLSHIEPASEAKDYFIWRCVCGEKIERMSLRESTRLH